MATMLLEPAGANENQRGKWANTQDWLEQKDRIKHLYIAKPLPEVMRIMENQHGFKATQKMYKSRIQQWGLAKYHRENEMRAAVRKQKQRADRGQASTVHVRGKVIQYKDLVRYFERKHLTIDDVVAQRRSSATPEAVECTTPVPFPIATPVTLAMPEQILLLLRDYCYGSFEVGTWVKSDPRKLCYSGRDDPSRGQVMYDLSEQVQVFCRLSEAGHSQEVGQALIAATAGAKEILLLEPPDNFEVMFLVIVRICSTEITGKYEIMWAILKTFSDLSEVTLCKNKPVRRLYKFLCFMDPLHLQELATRALEGHINHFEDLLGPMHISTLHARLLYNHMVYQLHKDARVEPALTSLLRTCDSMLGERDPRTMFVRLNLVMCVLNNERYSESLQLSRVILNHASSLTGGLDDVYFQAEGHRLLAWSQYGLREYHQAEMHLREAIRLRMFEWGMQDAMARLWLLGLEEWSLEWGQLESAEEIWLLRQEIMDSLKED